MTLIQNNEMRKKKEDPNMSVATNAHQKFFEKRIFTKRGSGYRQSSIIRLINEQI
jgi:hypothetical protein